MKINWKNFSNSKGYKSLKKAALATNGWHNEKGFNSMGGRNASHNSYNFKYVIDLVKKAMHKTGLYPCVILDLWEKKRRGNFNNYYQECMEESLFKMLEPLESGLVSKAN